MGSNGYAIGADGARDANALLLSNTHFPSGTDGRWYELHLTIPGRINAIGAALQGVPVVNVGFNRHIAWTHTVSTARRFAAYELKLVPGDPTSYMLDGHRVPMRERTVHVGTRSHTFYESVWGPVVVRPDATLDWTAETAYALVDVNAGNLRLANQWAAWNRAKSVADWRRKAARFQGNPWVNSIVADDRGNAYYGDDGAVPQREAAFLRAVRRAEEPLLLPAAGIAVIDGWRGVRAAGRSGAAVRGIFGNKVAPADRAARLHVQLQRLVLAAQRGRAADGLPARARRRAGHSCRARGWRRSWPSSGSRAATASARPASRSTTCVRSSSPTAT